MATHKHGAAEHLGPIVTDKSIGHPDLSIGHMIQQAMADSTKPSGQESAAEVHLPPISIPHGISEGLLARIMPSFAQRSPEDSGKGDGADVSVDPKGTSPDPLNTGGVREDLLSSLHPDPVARRDEVNDWITGGRPSSADLRSAVGINYGGNDAGAKNESAAESLIEHGQAGRERADSMHGTDPDGTKIKDETHQKKEFVNDYTDSHTGHAVHEVTTWNKDHSETHLVQDKTTGVEQLTQFYENGSTTSTNYDPLTGVTKVFTHDGETNQNHVVYYDANGKVLYAGQPSWAHELPSSTADNDQPSALPPLSELFKDVLKAQHPDSTTTNSAGDEIPGTVSGNVAGPIVDHPVHDGPADPGNPNVGSGEAGIPNGSPGTPSRDPSGNLINTTEAGTQRTGPDEPAHHSVNPSPPAPANADAAQGSANAPNGIHLRQSVGTVAETPAQHAAQELHDAFGEHSAQSQHGQVDEFAEFIRAAQNPLQTSFASVHQQAAPGALQHLDLGVDIANHGFGPHAGEDAHAVSLNIAPLAALHDTHVDHYAAPVLEVAHISHQ